MPKRECPLLIGKMADGDGLSLFRQVLEFYQPMGGSNRKKDIGKPSRKSVLDSFGFPPGSHAFLEISPES